MEGNMEYKIQIIEGHDSSSYFWFHPAIVKEAEKIMDEEVILLKEEISIEEGDVDCFLSYFLYKYFDKELYINKHRYEPGVPGYINDFEWYLEHNFYTYECMDKMLCEIDEVAGLLMEDYDNPRLTEVKERYSIFYVCDRSHPDYQSRDDAKVKNHKKVITDFYYRFTNRMRKMMMNNPNTNIISIMGP